MNNRQDASSHRVRILTHPACDLDIPADFSRLQEIVYNLWWTWSPDAHELFRQLSPQAWARYRNPIDVLIDLDRERWQAMSDSPEFARIYRAVVDAFDRYLDPQLPTWFNTHHADRQGGPFAYFSAEFGWHECLHTYSGGLGILAGDHCKSASDLGLPFVGVGLMYRHGYFRQSIDAEGFQQHLYPDFDMHRLPLTAVVDGTGRELHVPVALPGRDVHLRAWRATVGRVPVLLLDADLPINHPADRAITSVLYVRGREMRLCQEILLGIGGARFLEALGIEPSVWHINEGHSALLTLHRIERELQRQPRSLDQVLKDVAANTLFTTHTPVPAGNESFDGGLVRRYTSDWAARVGVDLDTVMNLGRTEDEGDTFNLTALALRSSSAANGVSELHGQVADGMWKPLLQSAGLDSISSVTNGIHPSTWIGRDLRGALARHAGDAFRDGEPGEGFNEAVAATPGYEIWTSHMAQKRRLIDFLRESIREQSARHGRSPDELREVDRLLDPDALTIGFARRFATYKRADLILRDEKKLQRLLLDSDRPVQLVFAGKAHPADRPGQDMIRRIYQASRREELKGRIVFIESYDMRIGRALVQGVDLWLNTPRRPHEASGTSGMKAAANGVLNCSILDGWWVEGFDSALGWAIGDEQELADEAEQDAADADALYAVLLDEVIPAYFARNEQGLPEEWIRRMKRCIGELTPRFSSSRMVRDYVDRFYIPATRGTARQK